MLRAQGLFPDCQRPLIERLGLGVLALGVVHRPQVVEARGHRSLILSAVVVSWPTLMPGPLVGEASHREYEAGYNAERVKFHFVHGTLLLIFNLAA